MSRFRMQGQTIIEFQIYFVWGCAGNTSNIERSPKPYPILPLTCQSSRYCVVLYELNPSFLANNRNTRNAYKCYWTGPSGRIELRNHSEIQKNKVISSSTRIAFANPACHSLKPLLLIHCFKKFHTLIEKNASPKYNFNHFQRTILAWKCF